MINLGQKVVHDFFGNFGNGGIYCICHEGTRLDTEQRIAVVPHPPKAARKAYFPDEGDIDDSAGNRTGTPHSQISQDLSQPPVG